MKVVNIRKASPGTFIKCDRTSRWGNPFILGVDGTRDLVCDLYERYAAWRIWRQPDWLEPLKEAGLDLGCHCAPHRCHCDTLLRLIHR